MNECVYDVSVYEYMMMVKKDRRRVSDSKETTQVEREETTKSEWGK